MRPEGFAGDSAEAALKDTCLSRDAEIPLETPGRRVVCDFPDFLFRDFGIEFSQAV